MCSCRFVIASLAAIATFVGLAEPGRADEELKVAVGGRGIGETFVTEVGYKAGLFKPHNLALDIFYTDGGGETQQAVISNSAQSASLQVFSARSVWLPKEGRGASS